MTRDQAIDKFANFLKELHDYELNRFFGQDSQHVWNFRIIRDKETGEWDAKMS